MGQNESSSQRQRSQSVTPRASPKANRKMISNGGGLGKLELPKMRKGRRSSDVVDLRGRSPSPHKMLLPGYHLTHHQRRLSIDEANIRSNRKENSFLPILPKSQEESTGNGKHSPSPAQSPSKSSSSPKKRNSKKNRRKSRDFNISVLPAFMGGKKRIPAKLNELADEKRLDTPPQIPAEEIFIVDEVEDDLFDLNKFLVQRESKRRRAKSINPMALSQERHQMDVAISNVIKSKKKKPSIPTVFRYNLKNHSESIQTVYVAGTMNDWRSRPMASFGQDESNFVAIIDCVPGKYYYKFCVDGKWTHDESQPLMLSKTEVKANVMTVKPEDREVFEALACDSFATKNVQPKYVSDKWTQRKPSFDEEMNNPPFLPPHLGHNSVLNNPQASDPQASSDPQLCPQPSSHVTLQHLYAQSIKDNLLVLAATTRYRKKCVTILYYTSME